MKVYWATRLRGFLKHLTDGLSDVEFIENDYYEVNNFRQKFLSKMIRLPLFDRIGKFSVVRVNNKDCDMYASFNRFLDSDKPYFIYLENPTALYHYCLDRISYPAGKRKFQECIHNKNLKGIACMSNACRDTFEAINGALPADIIIRTIYPLVPNNNVVNEEKIKIKSHRETLELLYCVQGVRFVSKGGLEVLEAIKRLSNDNIHLTVVTKISDIDKSILKDILAQKNVTLFDFNLQYEELERLYADTNLLVQPTSDDSFGLTILEAMKGGCAVLTSDLYSIPELVKDGNNGFLVEPKYRFFDTNNIPNPAVWNHRKKTIYSTKISERLVDDLCQRIGRLEQDRDLLEQFSLMSYQKAIDNSLFGEGGIKDAMQNFLTDCLQ